MFPTSTVHDIADSGFCDTVSLRESQLHNTTGMFCSDGQHVRFVKFSAAMPRPTSHTFGPLACMVFVSTWIAFRVHSMAVTFTACVSTLLHHVSIVINQRTEKQVAWITAGRVVTSMQNAHSRRVRSCVDEKGQTMGAVSSLLAFSGYTYNTVAINILSSLPFPALIVTSVVNSLRKSLKFLGCENGQGMIMGGHDLNLRYRLGLWSGSLAAQTAFGPFSSYHTRRSI